MLLKYCRCLILNYLDVLLQVAVDRCRYHLVTMTKAAAGHCRLLSVVVGHSLLVEINLSLPEVRLCLNLLFAVSLSFPYDFDISYP